MTGPTCRDRIFGELAVLGQALANPHRLELLVQLERGAVTIVDVRPYEEFQQGHSYPVGTIAP
jgi:hypothetical protein